MLIRDKKTKPQKELSAADRLKNLSGAFRAGTIPEGIKILRGFREQGVISTSGHDGRIVIHDASMLERYVMD